MIIKVTNKQQNLVDAMAFINELESHIDDIDYSAELVIDLSEAKDVSICIVAYLNNVYYGVREYIDIKIVPPEDSLMEDVFQHLLQNKEK